ncbi:hypothetical protein LPU83_pLPU83c_0804 (plasmid) [Rhizobium favelukesii]|uniref:Uncharacterized protein n=1 Tax=Rhizobium favelukesii TaxID=348824 RepID=W6S506_9HYPH|nr:hypothetical protein LPU83_pLPU83c_0804 [Rhizobium favelukesii]
MIGDHLLSKSLRGIVRSPKRRLLDSSSNISLLAASVRNPPFSAQLSQASSRRLSPRQSSRGCGKKRGLQVVAGMLAEARAKMGAPNSESGGE